MSDLRVRRPPGPIGGELQVVLIHGAMDRAASFEGVRRRLADLYVVSYDRRGYGSSPPLAAPVDLPRQVSDLFAVMGGLPSVLVGHSFGGLIALVAATEAPEVVRAVGIYEPPMPWLDEWPVPPAFDEPARAAEVFFRRLVGEEIWQGLSPTFRDQRRAEGVALMSDFASAGEGIPFDPGDVLSPVAVACGSASADHYQRAAAELCHRIHGTELTVIEGAAHGVHQSHPDAFAGWVRTVVRLAEAE